MSDYSRLISEKLRKARKAHPCDACLLVHEDIYAGSEVEKQFTKEEIDQWSKACVEHRKIQIGQMYLDQTLEFDGIIYHFKARPEIYKIVEKYKIWSQD